MERDFYFLGARLKAKIEQLTKEKLPQQRHMESSVQNESSTNGARVDMDIKNDLAIKFDQLSVHNQTLQREAGNIGNCNCINLIVC